MKNSKKGTYEKNRGTRKSQKIMIFGKEKNWGIAEFRGYPDIGKKHDMRKKRVFEKSGCTFGVAAAHS